MSNLSFTAALNGAFPATSHSTGVDYGLNKLEYFAAMAMQGILSSYAGDSSIPSYEKIASMSVKQAIALFEECQKVEREYLSQFED